MKKILPLGIAILIALAAIAGAAEEKTTTKNGKPYFEASDKISEQATVLAVDAKTRVVTLQSSDGDTVQVVAGSMVKNFAQIKPNDTVDITYTEQLTIHIEAPGSAGESTENMTSVAKPGEKPSASVAQRTTYKATIAAIDKAKGTATLKGYDGKEFTVTPHHPENLDKVSVGEMVVFTYTEAIAASVKKVVAKPEAKPAPKS